jgi:hypothetical protein
MSDVTRMEPGLQVSNLARPPSRELTIRICQAIAAEARRNHEARQRREAAIQARYGCCPPAWAAEYIRRGRVPDREAGQ